MEIKRTLITWAIGIGASVATARGEVAFWLGVTVTILTAYKIILDIQIKRRALKDIKLTPVDKDDDIEEDKL